MLSEHGSYIAQEIGQVVEQTQKYGISCQPDNLGVISRLSQEECALILENIQEKLVNSSLLEGEVAGITTVESLLEPVVFPWNSGPFEQAEGEPSIKVEFTNPAKNPVKWFKKIFIENKRAEINQDTNTIQTHLVYPISVNHALRNLVLGEVGEFPNSHICHEGIHLLQAKRTYRKLWEEHFKPETEDELNALVKTASPLVTLFREVQAYAFSDLMLAKHVSSTRSSEKKDLAEYGIKPGENGFYSSYEVIGYLVKDYTELEKSDVLAKWFLFQIDLLKSLGLNHRNIATTLAYTLSSKTSITTLFNMETGFLVPALNAEAAQNISDEPLEEMFDQAIISALNAEDERQKRYVQVRKISLNELDNALRKKSGY
jgi:hypothetical protein